MRPQLLQFLLIVICDMVDFIPAINKKIVSNFPLWCNSVGLIDTNQIVSVTVNFCGNFITKTRE